jgi:uncharacterized protein YcfJ
MRFIRRLFGLDRPRRGPVTTLAAVAMLASCATAPGSGSGYGAGWEPVVDVRAAQMEQYPADLAACQAHATRVMSAADAAVAGAVVGAIFGALLGAAAGGNSRFNREMAGVGALSGGVGAAASAEGGQRGIISRCLAGRGYSVLN